VDAFQKQQQLNAEALKAASLELAQNAKTAQDRAAALREAERQANHSKNLGNA
jgi:hypothetical protein